MSHPAMDVSTRQVGTLREAGDPGRHGRGAAIDGRVYTKVM